MSTNFLNRRMDLIHEFKDGTHYLTMDTSYPVKINGLVLKLFVATCNYKVSDTNDNIAFSIKSANNVGSLEYEPMITEIKKDSVFNFNNDLIKDDAFLEGDCVMAIIDLFNDKLYLCSQTDFSKLVNEDDLADLCNFKMFDMTEKTADRLAMAVAFQKDGVQPDYKEHFSLTRNGNPTEENNHGDYTVYQLIVSDNEKKDLKEIPVADTYVKSANEIAVFIHPFMYLSAPGYIGERNISIGDCYKAVGFISLYGYLGNEFVKNFCFDYNFFESYMLIDKNSEQTKYSLYNDGVNGKFMHYIEKDKDGNPTNSAKNDYNYIFCNDHLTSSFDDLYAEVFRIRKVDNLFSILESRDIDLKYNDSSNISIDLSGENSKFSSERWGVTGNAPKYIEAYYEEDNENNGYKLKSNNASGDLSNVQSNSYFGNKYIIPYSNVSESIDIVHDPYLYDSKNNSLPFSIKNPTASLFNTFTFTRFGFKEPQNENDISAFIHLYNNNKIAEFFNDKHNMDTILYTVLGCPSSSERRLSYEVSFNNKRIYKEKSTDTSEKIITINNALSYDINIVSQTHNKIFTCYNTMYIFIDFNFVQSFLYQKHQPISQITPLHQKHFLSFPYYNLNNYLNLSIGNNNQVLMNLRSNSQLVSGNSLIYVYSNDSTAINYRLLDYNDQHLTLYSFLNFRMFNFNDDLINPMDDNNDYYYGSNENEINARVINYKIDNTMYDNLYIRYFSSITNNSIGNDNHGISNIYVAQTSHSKVEDENLIGKKIYIKCKCDNKDYILCISAKADGKNIYNPIQNFKESYSIDDINDFSSYCLNSESKFIDVQGKTFETDINDETIYPYIQHLKIIFDDNRKFKLSFNTKAEESVFNSTDIINYCRAGGSTGVDLTSDEDNDNENYMPIAMNKFIDSRSINYKDKSMIISDDDFFLAYHDIQDKSLKIPFIDFHDMEFHSFSHNVIDNPNENRMTLNENKFFKDGTLANRNLTLPFICNELSDKSYYQYLKYIKSHSCLELFNIYKDYENTSLVQDKYSQIKNNKIAENLYKNSDGSDKSIYEFFRTMLKYYYDGTLKDDNYYRINGFYNSFKFLSKNDIQKTITDSSDHQSIRPHHAFIVKDSKDTLDINSIAVHDSTFVKYSDNIHGDKCYMSTDSTNTFDTYVYIKKHSNSNISLKDNDTVIEVSINNTKVFTIQNLFNIYNNTNKKKFTLVGNINSNTMIYKTQVPIGNIYAMCLFNEITDNTGVIDCDIENGDYKQVYGDAVYIFKNVRGYGALNNNEFTSYIDISIAGFKISGSESDTEINSMYHYTKNTYYWANGNKYIRIDSGSKCAANYIINGNKYMPLRFEKLLPKAYTFSVGEPTFDSEGKINGWKPESRLIIESKFNSNNINSSTYISLPLKYQSTDSNIYKTVVETGLRKSQGISLTDSEGNMLSLNGIEKKEVDTLNWYDLLIALNNNQYIDILGENLINLKKTLSDNPDIMQDMSDLSGIKNDISDIRDNILAKLKIIKFYHEIPEISIQESANTVYDLTTIIDNMQPLSCLDLVLPETDSLITNKYYKDIKVPYYQTIGNIMNDSKVYGGHLTVFKFDDNKIYLEYINKGNDVYFTHKANIMTDFNDPSIWIKKNSPKVYSEININLDYNKEDFVKTLSDMNPNSTLDITFPFNDDINNLDKTSIIYAGAMIFEANSRANPNFNYNINVTLNCLDEDNTQITLNSVRTDCAGMSEAIVRYLGYNVKHSPDTIGVTVADFYQMTTDAQNISSIRDKQNNVSQNFKLIPYSKDKLLPGDLIIYSGRHIEQYIYTDNDGTARGFNAGSSDSMRDSVSLAKYIAENKSVPEFSSHLGSTLNIEGLNIGLESGVKPDYILRYRYINGNSFLPYSMSDDGYLEPGGHLVISALRPNENVINVNVEFTNYRNDKYNKYLIINKIGDLNSYCTFKWLTDYVNLNKLNTILVNWHDAITTKPELTDAEKTAKTNEFKAAYEKLADDNADKKKYDTADKYAEAKLKEYIDGLDEVEKEPAKKEIIYGLSTDDSNHIIEIQSGDFKVLNFNENDKNNDKKELCLKAYSSIEPSIIFENIKNDTTHTRLNSSKLIFNDSICIVDGKRTYNLTISNPFYNVQKSNSVNKYKEQISIRILYKRINPDIIDVDSQ